MDIPDLNRFYRYLAYSSAFFRKQSLARLCYLLAALFLLFAPTSGVAQSGYGNCDTPSNLYVWPLGGNTCYQASINADAVWDPDRADWGYGGVFPPNAYTPSSPVGSRPVPPFTRGYGALMPYMRSTTTTGDLDPDNAGTWGNEGRSCHGGLDLHCGGSGSGTSGATVHALANGRVIKTISTSDPLSFGREIVLEFWHEKKQKFCYARYRYMAHVEPATVSGDPGYCYDERKSNPPLIIIDDGEPIKAGDSVCAGDVIGVVRNNWIGFQNPHLSLEISCTSTMEQSVYGSSGKFRAIDPRISATPYPASVTAGIEPDDQEEGCYGNAYTMNAPGFRHGGTHCCQGIRTLYEDPRELLLAAAPVSKFPDPEQRYHNPCLFVIDAGFVGGGAGCPTTGSLASNFSLNNCTDYADFNHPGTPLDHSNRNQCAREERVAGSKSLSCIRRKKTRVNSLYWNDDVGVPTRDRWRLNVANYAETNARNAVPPSSTGTSAALGTPSQLDLNEPSRVLLAQDAKYGPAQIAMDCLSLQPYTPYNALTNPVFDYPFRFPNSKYTADTVASSPAYLGTSLEPLPPTFSFTPQPIPPANFYMGDGPMNEVRERLNSCTNEYILTSLSTNVGADPVDRTGIPRGLDAEICQPLRTVPLTDREKNLADNGLRLRAMEEAYFALSRGQRWVPGTLLPGNHGIQEGPTGFGKAVSHNDRGSRMVPGTKNPGDVATTNEFYAWWCDGTGDPNCTTAAPLEEIESRYNFPDDPDGTPGAPYLFRGAKAGHAGAVAGTYLSQAHMYPYERIYDPSHPFSPRHYTHFDGNDVLTDRNERFSMSGPEISSWNTDSETPTCNLPGGACETRCDGEVEVDIMVNRQNNWSGNVDPPTALRGDTTSCMNPRWARNRMMKPDGSPREVPADPLTGWGGIADLRIVPDPNDITECWNRFMECVGGGRELPTAPSHYHGCTVVIPEDIPDEDIPPDGNGDEEDRWREWLEDECRPGCAMGGTAIPLPSLTTSGASLPFYEGWINCATNVGPWWDTATELPCAIQNSTFESGGANCAEPTGSHLDLYDVDILDGITLKSSSGRPIPGGGGSDFLIPTKPFNAPGASVLPAPDAGLTLADMNPIPPMPTQAITMKATPPTGNLLPTIYSTQTCTVGCARKCQKIADARSGANTAYTNCYNTCRGRLPNCSGGSAPEYTCASCFQACNDPAITAADRARDCVEECQSAICSTLYGETCTECVIGCAHKNQNIDGCIMSNCRGLACAPHIGTSCWADALDISGGSAFDQKDAAVDAIRRVCNHSNMLSGVCNYDAVDDLTTVPLPYANKWGTEPLPDRWDYPEQVVLRFTEITPSHFFDRSPVAMKCNIFLHSNIGGWGDGSGSLGGGIFYAPLAEPSPNIPPAPTSHPNLDALPLVENFIFLYPEVINNDHGANKNDTIQECCHLISRPLPMTNVLKVRHRQIAWPDRSNTAQTVGNYNAPEGYTFEEYFGDHRPYMRWWDTGKEAGAVTADSLNPARDGVYDAIVGIGIEGQQCGFGGWRTQINGVGFSSINPGRVLPDPNSSWLELKLWQARSYRHFHLRCLARNDRTFKKDSPEDFVLRKAGGEYTTVTPFVETDPVTGDYKYYGVMADPQRVGGIIMTYNNQPCCPATGICELTNPECLKIETPENTHLAPLGWRGYTSDPLFPAFIPPNPAPPSVLATENYGFPYYNSGFINPAAAGPDHVFLNPTSLDMVRTGDILVWRYDAPIWDGFPTMPHAAYVVEARTYENCRHSCEIECNGPGGCSSTDPPYNDYDTCEATCVTKHGAEHVERVGNPATDINARSQTASLLVDEYNYGKFPDACGYTSNWGLSTRRTLLRPVRRPGSPVRLVPADPDVFEAYQALYTNVLPTAEFEDRWFCSNSDNKECVEGNWGSSNNPTNILVYRPRSN